MKNVRMSVLSLLLAVLLALPAAAGDFPDLGGHWGEPYVHYWTGEGVVNGYLDGTFLPDREISRCEAAAVVSRLLRLNRGSGEPRFADVFQGDWHYDAVTACAQNGIFTGDSDGRFRPDDNMTREEAMSVIWRVSGLAGYAPGVRPFEDGEQVDDWAAGSVGGLIKAGVADGYEISGKRYIKPDQAITRAEFMKLLYLVEKEYGWCVGNRGEYYTIVLTIWNKGDESAFVTDKSSAYLTGNSNLMAEIVPMIVKNRDVFKQVFGDPAARAVMDSGVDAYRAGNGAWSAWLDQYTTPENSALAQVMTDIDARINDLGRGRWELSFTPKDATYNVVFAVCSHE